MHFRQLVRGAGITFALRIAAGGLEFLLNLVVARTFGAEGAGVFFIALTVTMVSSTFARLGLDNALLRLGAAYAATGEWGSVKHTATRGIFAALLMSILITALILVLADQVAVGGPAWAASTEAIKLTALAIMPLSVALLYGELFKSVRRVFASQFIAAVLIPGVTLLIVMMAGTRIGIEGVSLAYVIGCGVAALLGWVWWRRAMAAYAGSSATVPWRVLLAGTPALLWVKTSRLALGWMAVGVLAAGYSTAEVGIFSVALRVSLALGLVLMAVNSVVAPQFAAQIRSGDPQQLARTVRRAALLINLVGGPVVALFILAPGWVMSWFGPSFETQGGQVLWVMAVGQIVNLLTGPVNYLLMMSGDEQKLARTFTLSVLIGGIVLVVLTPSFGALGAAIAISLAMAIQNIAAAHRVWKKFGIITVPFVQRFLRRNPP